MSLLLLCIQFQAEFQVQWRIHQNELRFEQLEVQRTASRTASQTKWKELYRELCLNGLPDTYYAGMFDLCGFHVVGIGCDVGHRRRAGCLGLAVLTGGKA